MTESKIGRGFGELAIEEQVRALRTHAIGQEVWIRVLIEAVSRLGVTFKVERETGDAPAPPVSP